MTWSPVLMAGLAACLLAAAATVAVAAWRGEDQITSSVRRWAPSRWTGRSRRVAAALLIVLVATAITGVVTLGVATALAVWLVPRGIAAARADRRRRDMVEATRMWLLQLQAVLAAGRGLRQGLADVAAQQPADSVLAGPLARLSIRMDRLGEVAALEAFAIEVDNQVADSAVTVLIAAVAYQNVQVGSALAALVPWAEQDVARLRERDVRLRSLRTERWMMLGVVGLMAGYFVVSAPWLMDAYAGPTGQLVLAAMLATGGFLVWLIGWMSRLQRPPRWFTRLETSR